jgi:hypothetical protein
MNSLFLAVLSDVACALALLAFSIPEDFLSVHVSVVDWFWLI